MARTALAVSEADGGDQDQDLGVGWGMDIGMAQLGRQE